MRSRKKMLLLIWQNETSSTKGFSQCLPKPLMTYSQALWLNNKSGDIPNPARSPKPTWLKSIVPVAKAWYILFLPYCFWLVSLPLHHKIVDIFKSLICNILYGKKSPAMALMPLSAPVCLFVINFFKKCLASVASSYAKCGTASHLHSF